MVISLEFSILLGCVHYIEARSLDTGDVLVLAEWDRATRSMSDGISIMQRVAARGTFIQVLDKPHLDLTTKIGQGILAFLSALTDDERDRIVKRAGEGRNAAKAKGVTMDGTAAGVAASSGERSTSAAGVRRELPRDRQKSQLPSQHHFTLPKMRSKI